MPKKKSNPTATVARDATGGQDNPGVTTENESLIDPGVVPDEMLTQRFRLFVLQLLRLSLSYVSFLNRQRWWSTSIKRGGTALIHVITIGLDEVKDFHMVRDDGITYAAKVMLIHLCFSSVSCCIANVNVANFTLRFRKMTLCMGLVVLGSRSIAVRMITMMT
jgi:hypothetical protein